MMKKHIKKISLNLINVVIGIVQQNQFFKLRNAIDYIQVKFLGLNSFRSKLNCSNEININRNFASK